MSTLFINAYIMYKSQLIIFFLSFYIYVNRLGCAFVDYCKVPFFKKEMKCEWTLGYVRPCL